MTAHTILPINALLFAFGALGSPLFACGCEFTVPELVCGAVPPTLPTGVPHCPHTASPSSMAAPQFSQNFAIIYSS